MARFGAIVRYGLVSLTGLAAAYGCATAFAYLSMAVFFDLVDGFWWVAAYHGTGAALLAGMCVWAIRLIRRTGFGWRSVPPLLAVFLMSTYIYVTVLTSISIDDGW